MKSLTRKFLMLPLFLVVLLGITACKSSELDVKPVDTKTTTELSADEITVDSLSSFVDNLFNNELEKLDAPSDDEELWVIVQLKDQPMLMNKENSKFVGTVSEYLATTEAKKQLSEMEKSQEVVQTSILSKIGAEFKYSYTSVFNGFAAKVKYGDLDKLKAVAGVKNICPAITYAIPETDYETTSTGTPSSDTVTTDSSTAYTGRGMSIGIIDTGISTSHEAFSIEPEIQAVSKASINKVIGNTIANVYNLKSHNKSITANDVYQSGKIPFAYDYADVDCDVNPNLATMEKYGNEHGTHVAGIAAGNNGGSFKGVAPDAQLVVMKVFSDYSNGASSINILAALNDCVALGVDSINMSLGTPSGFTTTSSSDLLELIYSNVEKSGINLCCSCGNAFYSQLGGIQYQNGSISNVDGGTVGTPGAYGAAFATASLDTVNVQNEFFTANDEKKILFFNNAVVNQETKEKADFVKSLLPEGGKVTLDYVVVPGTGDVGDYADIYVKGKVALVKRGGLSFEQKQANAKAAGAVACILYNNVGGQGISPVIEKLVIPTACISLEDGTILASAKKKNITVNSEYKLANPQMSEFSSWGPVSDLTLKPEITAPGGQVYSAFPNATKDGYIMMSGTSMSSPNMAGCVTLVKQALKEKYGFELATGDMTLNDIQNMVYQLLMSTATPVTNVDGVIYSPRKQGAGLANVNNAVNTKAYLYVIGQTKTKLELGDDPQKLGVYELTFRLKNTSNQQLVYNINPKVMTQALSLDGVNLTFGEYYFDDANCTYSCSGKAKLSGNEITVQPNADVQVSVNVKLTDADKKYLEQFTYGTYVEGYVSLDAADEAEVDLSIPFLGFYGDWNESPLLDSTIYDSNTSYMYETSLVSAYRGQYLLQLGKYPYKIGVDAEGNPLYKTPETSVDKISISPANEYGLSNLYSVYMGLLRNAKTIDYSFEDAITGEVYALYRVDEARRSLVNLSKGTVTPTAYVLGYNQMLPNNTDINLVITATPDYDDASGNAKYQYTFPIRIDNEAPQLMQDFDLVEEEGRKYLEFVVADNNYLCSLQLMNSEFKALASPIPFYTKRGETTLTRVDITDYVDLLKDNVLVVYVDDYSLNYSAWGITLPLHAVTEVGFEKAEYEINVNGSVKLNPIITPSTGYIKNGTVVFASSDEKIAKVDQSGVVIGVSAGTCEVSLTLTTVNDAQIVGKATIKVNPVVEAEVLPDGVTLDQTELSVKLGQQVTLTPTVSPWNAVNKEVTWTSSNEAVATVEAGLVKTLASGVATITCKTVNGLEATCVITVEENSADFTIVSGVLTAYTGKGGDITIPEGVTKIGKNAFDKNTTITTIVLPSSLVEISDYAFRQCTALTSVKLSGSKVVTLGKYCFYHCSKLTECELPASIESIGDNCFKDCSALEKVNVPASIQTIGASSFGGTKISTVAIPSSCVSIGNYAFQNCTTVTSLTFGVRSSGLTIGNIVFQGCTGIEEVDMTPLSGQGLEVGVGLFSGCKKLATVKLPTDLTRIFGTMFKDCILLNTLDIPATVVEYGASAFEGTGFTEFVVSNHVTTIGSSTFSNMDSMVKITFENDFEDIPASLLAGCSKLTDIIFKGAITGKINVYAFKDCTSLVTFAVPSGVVALNGSTFYGCTNLKEVTISATVTLLGKETFRKCTNLEKVIFAENGLDLGLTPTALENMFNACTKKIEFVGNNVYASSTDGALYSADKTVLYKVCPVNELIVDGVLTVPSGVTTIFDEAFAEYTTLTGVVLPDTVTTIGEGAFVGCSKLAALTLSKNLVTIGASAFKDCKLLTQVNFAELTHLEVLASGAFYKCPLEGDLVLPESLLRIEDGGTRQGVFVGSKFTSVTFGANLEYIGNYAFNEVSTITSIDLSGTKVEAIGDYAFYQLPLQKMLLSKGLVSIGKYAFYNGHYDPKYVGGQTTVEEIVFPETLESIGAYAFMGWTYLRHVNLPDSVTELGNNAFRICVSLETISLGSGITSIGSGTFGYIGFNYKVYNTNWESYKVLTEVFIPNTVTFIDDQAFTSCFYLVKFEVEEGNPVYRAEDGVIYDDKSIVQWPYAKPMVEEYRIPSFINTVNGFLFTAKITNVKKLIIPSSVTSIESGALAKLNVQEIFFETNKYLELGDGVFQNCKKLVKVTLPEGLAYVPSQTFDGCVSLSEIVWPESLQMIQVRAFRGCVSLKSLVFNQSLKYIQAGAFENCTGIETVQIPKMFKGFVEAMSTSSFAPSVFEGCTSLVEFTVAKGCENFEVEEGVLYSKDGKQLVFYPQGKVVDYFTVPEGVEKIGFKAFANVETLIGVQLPTTLKVIGDSAFFGCKSLNMVVALGTKAPTLLASGYVSYQGSSYISYSNFVGNIVKVDTNSANPIWYEPLSGITLITLDEAVGYDSFAYQMIFGEHKVVDIEKALAIDLLQLEETADQFAILFFSASSFGQTFDIYRSTTEDGEYKLVASGLTEPLFIDESAGGLNATYYYKVVAKYTSGVGKKYESNVLTGSITIQPRAGQENILAVDAEIAALDDQVNISNIDKMNAVVDKIEALGADAIHLANIMKIFSLIRLGIEAHQVKLSLGELVKSTVLIEAKSQNAKLHEIYDVLTEDQKTLVTNSSILTEFDNDLKKASEFSILLAKIGNTVSEENIEYVQKLANLYSTFTDYDIQLTSNYTHVALSILVQFNDYNTKNAVENVISLIDQIPNGVTQGNKELITTARAAYELLSSEQKALVTNYDHLVQAEAQLPNAGCGVTFGATLLSFMSALSLFALCLRKKQQ